jgi:hypothetical protein
MTSIKWFRYGDQQPAQVRTNEHGRVNLHRLAAKFKLDPLSVELDGVLESSDAEGYTTVALARGDSIESPIIVTGHPTTGKFHALPSSGCENNDSEDGQSSPSRSFAFKRDF